MNPARAVVLLSGGMDSATVLAIARAAGYEVYALSVAYGQRHTSELAAAARLAKTLGAAAHKVVNIDLRSIGGSALTDDIEVPEHGGEGIPVTYVPARNTIMLSVALGWAEVLGAQDIFCGVNAVDYSGYPDCRPDYLEAFQTLADLATRAGREGRGVRLWAPLMAWDKPRIVREALRLGVPLERTWSCYAGGEQPCGVCDSCRIRDEALIAVGRADLAGLHRDVSPSVALQPPAPPVDGAAAVTAAVDSWLAPEAGQTT